MEFHGIEMQGQLILEMSVLPAWAAADEGRIIYNTSDKKMYIGNDSAWVEVGSGGVSGTDGTDGTDGIDGAQWLTDIIDPVIGDGVGLDWFINTTSYEIFRKDTPTLLSANLITEAGNCSSKDQVGGNAAWMVIAGYSAAYWAGVTRPSWWQYEFPTAQTIIRLDIQPYTTKDFYLEASNNLSDWTLLLTDTCPTISTWAQFDIPNTNSYIYYRITVTSVHTGSGVSINEVQMKSGSLGWGSQGIIKGADGADGVDSDIVTIPVSGTDGDYKGVIKVGTVSETVSTGDLLYYNFSGENYTKSDASTASTMPARAIACESITLGNSGDLLHYGTIVDSSWSWIDGDIYTGTTTGEMTQIAPSGSGEFVQIVGYALTSTSIFFDPDKTVLVLS